MYYAKKIWLILFAMALLVSANAYLVSRAATNSYLPWQDIHRGLLRLDHARAQP